MADGSKKWQKLRENLASRIKKTAIVKNAQAGYIFCSKVNHVVDPSILKDAAAITWSCFLKKLPSKLRPIKVIGVPNRGKEFATALGLTGGLTIGVTERRAGNGNHLDKTKIVYDKREDMIIIEGIPSFTQGTNYTHTIRGIKPGETILVADDFCAYGHVAHAYKKSLTTLGIRPIFVFLVAKDFVNLHPPQIGFRELKKSGVTSFAVVRLTRIVNNRVAATAKDIV